MLDRVVIWAVSHSGIRASETQVGMATQNWPYFNGHVSRLSARSWRLGSPRRKPVGLLRAFYIDDPVSGEELLRFRKYSVGDRFSVCPRPDQLGLAGPSQALGG